MKSSGRTKGAVWITQTGLVDIHQPGLRRILEFGVALAEQREGEPAADDGDEEQWQEDAEK